MKLNDFIAGLSLLANHFSDRGGYHIGAEHDEFFVYGTDTQLTDEEYKRMRALGWHQEGGAEPNAPYQPTKGWHCFV